MTGELKNNNLGSSILEMTVLYMVIMVAMSMMGPYVIRSWNGYVQGAEDAVVDSYNDPLQKAGRVNVPGCTCDPIWTEMCGGPCGETSLTKTRACSPVGCGTQVECEVSNSCCTGWTNTGNCGADATNIVCNEGEMEQFRICGNSPPEYRCNPEPACEFDCLPESTTVDGIHDQFCPGDDQNLTSNVMYSYVSACTTDTKCEIKCLGDYVPTSIGCLCPDGYADLGNGQCEFIPKLVLTGSSIACEESSYLDCPQGFLLTGGGMVYNHNGCSNSADLSWMHSYPTGTNRYKGKVDDGRAETSAICMNERFKLDDIIIVEDGIPDSCEELVEVSCPDGYYMIAGGLDQESGPWVCGSGNVIGGYYAYPDPDPNVQKFYCNMDDRDISCYGVCAKFSIADTPSEVLRTVWSESPEITDGSQYHMSCPPGKRLIGGGIRIGSDNNGIWNITSFPVDNHTWYCNSENDFRCYTLCEQ